MAENNKNFALIGVAGYIAERHLRAMKDTNNNLLASLDKFDCVGKIDSYFPNSDFFTEFERFDRHIDKLKREGTRMDYVSICTQNYLHDSHIRFALRHGAEAICEKPVVLTPWNIDALQEIEQETGNRLWTILQLRLHPSIIKLKKQIEEGPKDKIHDVDLTYLTSRGHWYYTSWKGEAAKSGGIASNIGVHFYDMLSWIFGEVEENIVHIKTPDANSGMLKLKNANVRWFLSVNYEYIPEAMKEDGQRTYRSITVDGEEIEFSGGFADLHTRSYEEIIKGNGFGLDEAYASIEMVSDIRKAEPLGLVGNYHTFCEKIES